MFLSDNYPVASVNSDTSRRRASATIQASAHNFKSLSSGIYSDPKRAVLRELTANAVDAHVAAGKGDVPVEVWLPTTYSPDFIIKDEGIGMTDEFVMANFLNFGGGSTKLADGNQIGGFSYGSKSPFSYTDSFNLTSTIEGQRRAYAVYLDGGIPFVEAMGDAVETNEANGVTVSFPVKSDDFEEFYRTARDVLQYFNPLPIVHGPPSPALTPPPYIVSGTGWGLRKQSGPLRVTMGGVNYAADVPYNLRYEIPLDLRELLNFGLDITLPIGTVEVAVSREQVKLKTEDAAVLIAALTVAEAEMVPHLASALDDATSPWDACVRLNEEYARHSARASLIEKHARFNGAEVHRYMKFDGTFDVWDVEAPSRRRRRSGSTNVGSVKWMSNEYLAVNPTEIQAVVIVDTDKLSKAGFVDWLASQGHTKRILVVRGATEAHLRGCPAELIHYSSNMPAPKVHREKRAKTTVDTTVVRLGCREITLSHISDLTEFVFKTYNASDADKNVSSVFVDPDKLIYVHSTYEKRMLKLGLVPFDVAHAAGVDSCIARHGKLLNELAGVEQFASRGAGYYAFQAAQSEFTFNARSPVGKIINTLRRYVEPLKQHKAELAAVRNRLTPTTPPALDWAPAKDTLGLHYLATQPNLFDTQNLMILQKVI